LDLTGFSADLCVNQANRFLGDCVVHPPSLCTSRPGIEGCIDVLAVPPLDATHCWTPANAPRVARATRARACAAIPRPARAHAYPHTSDVNWHDPCTLSRNFL